MAGWVRYLMWNRWRDLTRFRLASEMELASYKTYLNDFPVSSPAALTVHDPSGDSLFKCGLEDLKLVLNDDEMLYRTLFPPMSPSMSLGLAATQFGYLRRLIAT